jgi:hypothetical protein
VMKYITHSSMRTTFVALKRLRILDPNFPDLAFFTRRSPKKSPRLTAGAS